MTERALIQGVLVEREWQPEFDRPILAAQIDGSCDFEGAPLAGWLRGFDRRKLGRTGALWWTLDYRVVRGVDHRLWRRGVNRCRGGVHIAATFAAFAVFFLGIWLAGVGFATACVGRRLAAGRRFAVRLVARFAAGGGLVAIGFLVLLFCPPGFGNQERQRSGA